MNQRRKPLAKLTTRLTLLALLGSGAFEVPAAQHSRLWGRSGELWSPPSRLPDFSYAGYRRGEKEIPRRAVDVSVKDFGARGDGRTDDTAAFQKAIAESAGKVIFVPRGNYRITDFLTIAASGTVLRGAGPTRSVFVFPKPLDSVKPNWGATTSGKRTSNYSWSGGYVRIVGQSSDRKLADVSSPAKRGDQSLAVSDPSKFQAGEDYELRMSDAGNRSLTKHLYAGDAGPISNLKNIRESFVFRVSRLDAAAKRIHFDRPLRTDVRAEWRPHLVATKCSVEECGIEELGFAFPNTAYQGHFTELGFNAVDLRDVRHCWVRNIRIHNADSGVFVRGVNNTLTGLHITSARTIEKSRKATGHHGVTLGGQDNLLTRYRFETRFMHGVTVTRGSAGNVASSGIGPDLSFDHHRYAPHSNLFTDIHLGEGSRMFQSGGGAKLGHHCAAWATFWGIRARRPQSWPKGFGPDRMNLVGVQPAGKSDLKPTGRWFEAIDPMKLSPRNLHQAQLERRLKAMEK